MSQRLDAILAAVLNLSRAKAQELVRQGRVSVNWREETRTDREVGSGDTLSIRGQGRVVVGEQTGQSRKGRLYLSVETYLD
jgi:RNA-binding protein YlmH